MKVLFVINGRTWVFETSDTRMCNSLIKQILEHTRINSLIFNQSSYVSFKSNGERETTTKYSVLFNFMGTESYEFTIPLFNTNVDSYKERLIDDVINSNKLIEAVTFTND